MKNGDILLLANGDFAMIVEMNFPNPDMHRIQIMEENESKFVDKHGFKGSINYGRDDNVTLLFMMNRSVHLRLNRLTKV